MAQSNRPNFTVIIVAQLGGHIGTVVEGVLSRVRLAQLGVSGDFKVLFLKGLVFAESGTGVVTSNDLLLSMLRIGSATATVLTQILTV